MEHTSLALRCAPQLLLPLAILVVAGSAALGQSPIIVSPNTRDESGTVDRNPAGALFAEQAIATGSSVEDESQDSGFRSFRNVVEESLVGRLRSDLWRPLAADDFFIDGWDEQYAPVPHDTPRQTWINNADGAFYRLYVFSFSDMINIPGAESGNGFNGSFFLFTPLNRRFEIGWFIPWATASPSEQWSFGRFGDLTIAPRFLLEESKTLTVTANLYIRAPTGDPINGNGVTSFSPDIEFWANPVDRWVVRGAAGFTAPLGYSGKKATLLAANPWSGFNANPGAFNSFDSRLAIGKYITPADAPRFSDLVLELSANLHTQLGGGAATYFSLTPGFRFGIGQDYYLLGGVEVPMVGQLPFTAQPIFQLIKNF
jgi:hypothetical protein